jgi:two-component system phosphate regulon response regulator PhoB
MPNDVPHSARPVHTVLVLVEEPAVRELLRANLLQAGLFPVNAGSADDACRLAGQVRPDLLLIDMDASSLRGGASPRDWLSPEDAAQVPIVMLTAHAGGEPNERARASASEGEAALCVAKPFSPRELVMQMVRLLRARPKAQRLPGPPRRLRVGAIELDAATQLVRIHGGPQAAALEIPAIELKLLRCLMEHPEAVVSREQIVASVWPDDGTIDLRTVDQNIKRLRRTLDRAGAGTCVRTVRGRGYRFAAPAG